MRVGVLLQLAVLACSASVPIARIEVERNSPAVHAGRLAQAIGIETLGGVFTPLLEVGCSIPCETTKTFSTAADNQSEVSIALFRGTADLAAHNHALGRFAVVGIPAAPRGVPQVSITFRADSTAITLVARELSGAAVQLRQDAQ
jgi:molecular chaperone DnaK